MGFQTCVIFLATIDLIWNGLGSVGGGIGLPVVIATSPDDLKKARMIRTPDEKTSLIVIGSVELLLSIIQVAFALYLKRGARERNPRVCCVWLQVAGGCMLIRTCVTIYKIYIVDGENTKTGTVGWIIQWTILAFMLFEILAVWCFRKEILSTVTPANQLDGAATAIENSETQTQRSMPASYV